jgi:hypothetical protein
VWTLFVDHAYVRAHRAARSAMSDAKLELIDPTREPIAEARKLERVCREREAAIGRQQACEERLALMESALGRQTDLRT